MSFSIYCNLALFMPLKILMYGFVSSILGIHCGCSFSPETIEEVRKEAARAFETLNLSDYARIDGWVIEDVESLKSLQVTGPINTRTPAVIISDVNTISGMEQASFLFVQAAEVCHSLTPLNG